MKKLIDSLYGIFYGSAAALFMLLTAVAFMPPSHAWVAQVPASGGGGYTGPLDVVSGAYACWSFRACSASYATSLGGDFDWTCTNVTTFSGTVHVTATGGLNATELAALSSSCGGRFVRLQFYDQGGSGLYAGNATASTRPYLGAACSNSLPCGKFDGTPDVLSNSTGIAKSQPYTISAVVLRWGLLTTYGGIAAGNVATAVAYFGPSADTLVMHAPTNSASVTATAGSENGAPHELQFVFNGSSSFVNVDGVDSSNVNPGTNALSTDFYIGVDAGYGEGAAMDFYELIVWPSLSSGQRTNVYNNQRLYWAGQGS